jgi:hypothetical protein
MADEVEIHIDAEPASDEHHDPEISVTELLDAELGELRAEFERRISDIEHEREHGDWFTEERFGIEREALYTETDRKLAELRDEMHILFAYVAEDEAEEDVTIIEDAPPAVEVKEETEPKETRWFKPIVKWED